LTWSMAEGTAGVPDFFRGANHTYHRGRGNRRKRNAGMSRRFDTLPTPS
jgi:hypothetical protein